MPPFSIGDALQFGWQKIRTNSRIVLPAALILTVLQISGRFLSYAFPESLPAGFGQFFLFILEILIGIGIAVIMLKLARGQRTTLRDIIPTIRVIVPVILSGLMIALYALGIFACVAAVAAAAWYALAGITTLRYLIIGLIAIGFIVALCMLGLAYFFLQFVAIDAAQGNEQQRRVRAILTKAAMLTRGVRLRLLFFGIVMAVIYVIGSITVIGLLLAIPLWYLASARVYLKLLERKTSTAAN